MTKARIFYHSLPDDMRRRDKLDWFHENQFDKIPFTHLLPDEKNNWINLTDNDFETLLPVADKEVKAGKKKEALFELYSLGVVTNRDEWVYDFDEKDLEAKAKFFCEFFEKEKIKWNDSDKKTPINHFVNRTIKWTEELESHLMRGSKLPFEKACIIQTARRPFVYQFLYFDKIITHRVYQNDSIFGFKNAFQNKTIIISGISSSKPFQTLATNKLADLHFIGDSQCLPLYRYDATGTRHDNITDWGLAQFRAHYSPLPASPKGGGVIEKEDLFHYTYAVLHHPAYRSKYELNLKREFPRLPFYEDFRQWAAWGKRLMDLHIGYENVEPFPLKRTDVPLAVGRARSEASKQAMLQLGMIAELLQGAPSKTDRLVQPKCKLKANKPEGKIEIDEETILCGIPPEAWEYKLGNRSALEWVLDQYKEKKPGDPTIAEKFNTYRFADYKEEVIALLGRVCAVSLETVKIVSQMPGT